MAVPTTSNFIMNFDEIVDAAFARIGGEQTSGYNARSARRAIQVMLSDWSNRGMQMWCAIELMPIPTVANQIVYTMPSDCVDVSDLSIRDSSGVDVRMERIGRAQYQSIPYKQSKGRPNQFFVNRERDSVEISLYPVPPAPNGQYEIVGWYRRRLRDVDNYQNNLDIPFRYYEATISGMTYYMAREMPASVVDEAKLSRLKTDYMDALQTASDADQDMANAYIAADLTMYTGTW